MSAIFEFDDLKFMDICGSNILIKAGKNKKVEKNEMISPIVIIQPKSITGLISLKTSDKKAQIVVSTAYRIGKKIVSEVLLILILVSFKLSIPSICIYLTR